MLFKLEEVRKFHGDHFVLEVPSLVFQRGSIYALVGPNGSGKTALLNLLSLLERPSEGRILFESYDVYGPGRGLLEIRRRIVMVAQHPLLFRATVSKNVAYGLKIRSLRGDHIKDKVRACLKLVGLSGFERRRADQLSGGEAQRVAIARALCVEPEVLLLDEPTSNVDRRNIEIIERLIRRINVELGTTVIFTTHNLSQAYRLADEVISLVDGRVVEVMPENVFHGEVVNLDGLKCIPVSEHVHIALVTEKIGSVHISIDPRDIILSSEPLHSSARNSFSSRITQIVDEGAQVRLWTETDGVHFVSLITKQSFQEMGLTLGTNLFVTFKTTAVRVL